MRAIFAVAVLLIVGCGVQPSPGPKAPAKPQVSCVRLRTTPAQRNVTLTYADNHRTFCVELGTGIFVFLHGQTAALWTAIQASSSAIERRPSGVMSLVRGETGAFFEAVKPGAAILTSFEPRCPSGPRPGVRMAHRCPAPLHFSVVVHVL